MKIYLTYSIKLPTNIIDKIKLIVESQGHKLSTRERAIHNHTIDLKESETLFRNNTKNIKSADVVIVDISFISSGVGYELSFALDQKKPVIVLYNITDFKSIEGALLSVPLNVVGNTSKYLLLNQYRNDQLESVLVDALNNAKQLADTKFILIIPASIDRYLEWNAKELGKAKAEVTRDAIEQVMKSDKRYQEYLKSSGLTE